LENAGFSPKINTPSISSSAVREDITNDLSEQVNLYKDLGSYTQLRAEQHENILMFLEEEKNRLEEIASNSAVMLGEMETTALQFQNALRGIDSTIAGIVDGSVRDLASGIYDSLTGVQQFGDVLRDVAVNAVKQLVVALIQMGIQKVLLSTIFKSTLATDVAATVGGMAAISAAAAPAAAGTAIATAGASAITGGAALASTYGLAQVLGSFKSGIDLLPADGLAMVHKAERIVQPNANRDLTEFLKSR